MPSELVTRIKNATDQNKIWVSCMGEYPADKEAIGSFEYYPNDGGFPAMYFPYKNQKGSEIKTGLKMGLTQGRWADCDLIISQLLFLPEII